MLGLITACVSYLHFKSLSCHWFDCIYCKNCDSSSLTCTNPSQHQFPISSNLYSWKNISCSCSFPFCLLFLLLSHFWSDVYSDYTKCLSFIYKKKKKTNPNLNIFGITEVLSLSLICFLPNTEFTLLLSCRLSSFNKAHFLPAFSLPLPPHALSHLTFC